MDDKEREKIYREHFTKEGYADVEQWVKNELEADEDIKTGRITRLMNPEEVKQFLDSLKVKKIPNCCKNCPNYGKGNPCYCVAPMMKKGEE